jgi:carbohydrate kinase (thermoresistant glucokinase family)
MGVSGSGKTTIARALAARIGAEFIDADWLHSEENLAKMSSGHALGDEERLPWLHIVGEHIERLKSSRHSSVTACSALKRSYRDVLRQHVPDAIFVFLDGSFEVLQARITARQHEFMPPSLLVSQFATLEPLGNDEQGLRVDVELNPDEIVDTIETELRRLIIEATPNEEEIQ